MNIRSECGVTLNSGLEKTDHVVKRTTYTEEKQNKQDSQSPLILLIVADDFSTELITNLGQYNYNLAVLDVSDIIPANFIADIKSYSPAVIILENGFLDSMMISELTKFQQEKDASIPIVYISDIYSTKEHLSAVASGCSSFYVKPFDYNNFALKLDKLCEDKSTEIHTIIIIDDDASSAAYYAAILNASGFDAKIITNPLESIQKLILIQPDLILLDLYMPECTGNDLAIVIRQQDSLFNIPIVFLSGETDTEKQLISTEQGIDDFIEKNANPIYLIKTVRSRIKRSLQLKDLMIKDNLTGLLNRQAFQERLNTEISRSKRSKSELCLVMLDIDHFKKINDNYGHVEGDRFLKYLSTLLKRWLRHSDVICRYGGEEFVILLPDTKQADAFVILDKIRHACHNHVLSTDIRNYSTSFSCGIAVLNEKTTAQQLLIMADKAMYKAKNSGRNKVCLA